VVQESKLLSIQCQESDVYYELRKTQKKKKKKKLVWQNKRQVIFTAP